MSVRPVPFDLNVRRIVRIKAVAKACDCTLPAIYRYIKEEPNFPQPVRIGKFRIGFYEDELAAYLAQLPRAADTVTHCTGKNIKKKKAA